eukprot:20314_1
MGSYSSVSQQAPAQQPTTSQKSKISSKTASSFGDPSAEFRQNFQDLAAEEKIPAVRAKKTYQLYVWEKGSFDHHSVVIGCKQSKLDNVGFVTMELQIDPSKEQILPVSRFISKQDGEKYIEQNKWTQKDSIGDILFTKPINWNWEVETKMDNLIQLSIDLIQNHGKYSSILNSCQDFVFRFIGKCAGCDGLSGRNMVESFIQAGPVCAGAGLALGYTIGGVAGFASVLGGKMAHEGDHHNVKLQDD